MNKNAQIKSLFGQNNSMEEIASVMGITKGTVAGLIYRMRRRGEMPQVGQATLAVLVEPPTIEPCVDCLLYTSPSPRDS